METLVVLGGARVLLLFDVGFFSFAGVGFISLDSSLRVVCQCHARLL
jgi:hypothetical protein